MRDAIALTEFRQLRNGRNRASIHLPVGRRAARPACRTGQALGVREIYPHISIAFFAESCPRKWRSHWRLESDVMEGISRHWPVCASNRQPWYVHSTVFPVTVAAEAETRGAGRHRATQRLFRQHHDRSLAGLRAASKLPARAREFRHLEAPDTRSPTTARRQYLTRSHPDRLGVGS